MRDIVYFRADWPELEADPAGVAVAEKLCSAAEERGFVVGAVQSYYQGCAFYASRARITFLVEVTPYFEATPMEWSVQVHSRGIVARLLGHRGRAEMYRVCEAVLAAEPRLRDARWQRLADLAEGRLDDESPVFAED